MSRGYSKKCILRSEDWTFLVNNAGVFRFGAFAEITEESFQLHYNINVLGRFSQCRRRSSGSETREHHQPQLYRRSHPVRSLLYASTKGAIETLTRGLALELAPRKIRVNAIAPGHTETEGNLAAGTLRVVPAPFWLGRRRSAGSVASRTSPAGGIPGVRRIAWITERSFVPQAVSLWPPECDGCPRS